MIGQEIGQYRVIEQIGLGGMATVYKAYQPSMDRYVALKVLPRHFMHDPAFLGRFEREARTIAKLEHARILPVYDCGEHEGVPYLVMRYVEGGALSDLLKEHPEGLPLAEAARLIEQIASALDYAHEAGVIHRDIKPSNALVDRSGNLLLTDFGIAKIAEATVQFTGQGTVGTPAYMSPEQGMGKELTPATDVYSLGIVLYEMLTGRVPFQAETPIAVINAHIYDPLPLPRGLRPDLPEMVERVLLKALAKVPEARYQTAGEMAAALSEAVQMEPVAPEEAIEEAEPEMVPPAVHERPLTTLETIAAPPEVAEEAEPVVEEVEPTIPVEEPEPTPPAEPTPAMEAPSIPPEVVPAKPARAGLPGWVRGLLAVGGLLVIGLVLGGVFGRLAAVPTPSAEEMVAEEPMEEPTEEPTAVPTERPTEAPTLTTAPTSEPTIELAIALALAGVTSNNEWTPHIQEFGGVQMALVPAGCFMMGSEGGDSDEQPVHEVCFEEPFWIDVYEVTNGQYGSAGCAEQSSGDNQPRNCVNWTDALAHCEVRGARLPTEAEWEYAARGPDGLVYPWGNEFIGDYLVWNTSQTADVGSKPGGASWVGALDMSGNLWEWVADWYDSGYYGRSPRDNPSGPDSGEYRVLRGGSWDVNYLYYLRAAFRYRNNPGNWLNNLGFRCALSY